MITQFLDPFELGHLILRIGKCEDNPLIFEVQQLLSKLYHGSLRIKDMRFICYIVASGVFTLMGCGSNDITSPNDIIFPALNVSFRAHVQPLFTLSCNVSGCHDNISHAGNVDLSSWIGVRATNVVNQPGDTNCGLMQVIFGRELHTGSVNINENHRQGLKRWVIEGAQDN